jgi:hypothetical protein
MNSIYKLMCISEIIDNEYKSVAEFSFMDGTLRVRIIAPNGKRYGMAYEFTRSNDVDFNNWIDNIPNQFRDMLVKEALNNTLVSYKTRN